MNVIQINWIVLLQKCAYGEINEDIFGDTFIWCRSLMEFRHGQINSSHAGDNPALGVNAIPSDGLTPKFARASAGMVLAV